MSTVETAGLTSRSVQVGEIDIPCVESLPLSIIRKKHTLDPNQRQKPRYSRRSISVVLQGNFERTAWPLPPNLPLVSALPGPPLIYSLEIGTEITET